MDVLPLYIVLMGLFPLVLVAMLKRPNLVLFGSIVLYLVARTFGWNLPAYPVGQTLRSLSRDELNSGSSEILNWVMTAGMSAHLTNDWPEYYPAYRTPAGTGTGIAFATWP